MHGMWWSITWRQGGLISHPHWVSCNWPHNNIYHWPPRKPLLVNTKSVSVQDRGPLRASLLVSPVYTPGMYWLDLSVFHIIQVRIPMSADSHIIQHVILDADCPYLRFETVVSHSMNCRLEYDLFPPSTFPFPLSLPLRLSGMRVTSSSKWSFPWTYAVMRLAMKSSLDTSRGQHTSTPPGTRLGSRWSQYTNYWIVLLLSCCSSVFGLTLLFPRCALRNGLIYQSMGLE